MRALGTMILLLLPFAVWAVSGEIVVPAVHIPAIHVPAVHVPGHSIPGLGIEIAPIDIPAYDVPATDNTGTVVPWDDLNRADVIAYVQKPQKALRPAPRISLDRLSDRVRVYLAKTPWATNELVQLFTSADLDGSGVLTWKGVEVFQDRLYRGFRYFTSRTALRPDQFLASGGGDCKAFSLVSSEFFRFWGWEAWEAAFFNSTSGHAVCFVRANQDTPASYLRFQFRGKMTVEGDRITDGDYVPVDYDHVGSFSSATQAGMKMTELFTPSRVYGEAM